jgi:hypothetical protein
MRPALYVALLALGAALSVAVGIVMLEEAATARTRALVMLGAAAGGLTGAAILPLHALARRSAPRFAWILGALAAPGFIVAYVGLFALHNRFFVTGFEPAEGAGDVLRGVAFSVLGAAGLFVQTGMRYLLPWPAAAMGVLACAGLFALGRAGR